MTSTYIIELELELINMKNKVDEARQALWQHGTVAFNSDLLGTLNVNAAALSMSLSELEDVVQGVRNEIDCANGYHLWTFQGRLPNTGPQVCRVCGKAKGY